MAATAQAGQEASRLWQDYAFLTREMAKLLVTQDLELFLELMNQREKIQDAVSNLTADDYKTTTEGKELLAAINKQNSAIAADLQRMYNKSKNRNQIAKAYESLGMGYSGARMDSQS
ncbi:hypothetical protein SRRS_39800 [Sporomusa rhizae]|uniref:hypothetical protein n=1 Tax=Sporomusa rhizae TaxID=357999 RepID=UPI00352BC516